MARLDSGQCPLYAEIFDLLFRASSEVDWILIGFYPCLTDQIANAAIIDCRNNMFKESCRRQRLKRTEYLGLGKTEPFLKQSRVGKTEIELCGDKVNISIENPAEGICPELLFGTAIIDTARALNLDRSGEPYTATISVQLIYELVRMRSKGWEEIEAFGFLTTDSAEPVKTYHKKAMPVILTTEDEWDLWLSGDTWEHVKSLQRPLPAGTLKIVGMGARSDDIVPVRNGIDG